MENIKAHELRIGNWVLNDWLDTELEQYQIKHGYEIDEAIHQYYPIKLTSDWLEKFGFNRPKSDGINRYLYHYNSYLKINIEIDDDYQSFEYRGIQLKTVHQFQNLIFALTGTELVLQERGGKV